MQTRREFFRKTATATAAAVMPTISQAVGLADDQCLDDSNQTLSPVARELRRVANSPDAQAVSRMAADFYSDPSLVTMAQSFLNTASSSLSGFQKDIYNTYLTLAQDLPFLRRFLGTTHTIRGADLVKAQFLAKTVLSSPSFLTLQAAGSELTKISTLAPQLQTGIQEFRKALNSPIPSPTLTGIPVLDTVLSNFYTISQTPSFKNVSADIYQVTQRADFAAFVETLSPLELILFIPFASRVDVPLPLDAPDQPSQAAAAAQFLLAATIGFIGGYILHSIPAGATALVGALGWAAGLSVIGLALIIALCAVSTAAYGEEIAQYGENGNGGGGEGPPGNGSPGV